MNITRTVTVTCEACATQSLHLPSGVKVMDMPAVVPLEVALRNAARILAQTAVRIAEEKAACESSSS